MRTKKSSMFIGSVAMVAVRNYLDANRFTLISGYSLLKYLDSQTSANLSTTYCAYTSYC